MKKIFITLLIFLSFETYSQSRISYVSTNKDTLILPMDDIGLKIFKVWFEVEKECRPIILFSNPGYISQLNYNKQSFFICKDDNDITFE